MSLLSNKSPDSSGPPRRPGTRIPWWLILIAALIMIALTIGLVYLVLKYLWTHPLEVVHFLWKLLVLWAYFWTFVSKPFEATLTPYMTPLYETRVVMTETAEARRMMVKTPVPTATSFSFSVDGMNDSFVMTPTPPVDATPFRFNYWGSESLPTVTETLDVAEEIEDEGMEEILFK